MKSIMLSAFSLVKKTAFMLLAVTITCASAKANDSDSTHQDENAIVSCLKLEEGQVYFNVKFENADGGQFDILVNDINGENLYRATFTGQRFSKVFRSPVENGNLVIIICDGKDKINHKFELSTESRIVQQFLVKRIDL